MASGQSEDLSSRLLRESQDHIESVKAGATRKKGRGFTGEYSRYSGPGDSDRRSGGSGPIPEHSIEGWIVFVTGIHEEAGEEDLYDVFGEQGVVKNLHLNMDRRTGFIKGYAMVQYETFVEAESAIANLDRSELHGKEIRVSWAFVKPPQSSHRSDTARNIIRSSRRVMQDDEF
ncbi:RNA-binding protein 8A-like [Oopsacas minuta]|uniref:RNA-binding protein 8A n=1 Tax=Oopsacas minuta TaxID=111878 RepID=A0AAV7KAD9_9METZ|nr:RNA-binding protein 8A-like [Oopsacas minuta]